MARQQDAETGQACKPECDTHGSTSIMAASAARRVSPPESTGPAAAGGLPPASVAFTGDSNLAFFPGCFGVAEAEDSPLLGPGQHSARILP